MARDAGRRPVRGRVALAVVAVLALTALACKSPGVEPSASTKPPGPGGLPSSMAALGDSITAAFGTCLLLASCPRNSWSTGDGLMVQSHYRRIVAANPGMRGHAHNYAVPGAVAADLPAQAASAVGAGAQYVTILIGANDACRPHIEDMTSVADFRAALDRTLSTVKTGLPTARILVVSIPDVYQVWQVAHTNRAAVEVWSLGVCPALLANPTSTAPADVTRRAQFRDRVEGYDAQLQKACAAYGRLCHYDGGAVHKVAFGFRELSTLDFFHPNATGQDRLAEATYYLS